MRDFPRISPKLAHPKSPATLPHVRVSHLLSTVLILLLLSGPAAAERAPSLSMGTPGHGRLKNARRLPLSGLGYEVIELTRTRGFVFGTKELTALVSRMGGAVKRRFPTAILYVGNLSRRGGGDIPQSVTHNSGRDVDLLFYATDKTGKPVPRSKFLRFDKRGRAGDLRFDVRRNWVLVKAALQDKDVQVQSILVAHWLKKKLLKYAKRRREKKGLIARANAVLRHPWGAAPHDDHFHLRVYCSLHERLEGCINRGPEHKWANLHDAEVAALVAKLAVAARSKNPAAAEAALEHLGRLHAASAAPTFHRALASSHDRVRRAALAALRRVGIVKGAIATMISVARRAGPGQWRRDLVRLLADRRSRSARTLFTSLLGDSAARAGTRAAAARGIGALMWTSEVPALVEALADVSSEVRTATRDSLRRITGADRGSGVEARAAWRAWWKAARRRSRVAWLAEAFEASHGYPLGRKHCRKAVRQLIRQARAGGSRTEHARTLIKGLTRYDPGARGGSKGISRRYKRWLRKKRGLRRCRRAPKRLAR
ncbi:MAG: penicillin-insensitive murein endopeptidase [Myxococcota bacterium]